MATIQKYENWRLGQEDGTGVMDWNTDVFELAILESGYTTGALATELATHKVYTDLTNEITNLNGYVAGGNAIANPTATQSGGLVTVNGDDVTWLQNATGFLTGRFGVIYKDGGTKPLMGVIDFTTDKGIQNGDLTIQWHTNGIFTVA